MTPKQIAASVEAYQTLLRMISTARYYGGDITPGEWQQTDTYKYTIVRSYPKNELKVLPVTHAALPFTFHTREQAEHFLSRHTEDLKKYFMM